MDSLYQFVFDHAQFAHWFIFLLFMLAGINVPISEDILIIVSGILASTIVPENTWKLFLAVFLGAYISDWFAYWIGRKFGNNLWKMKWFSQMIKPHRLDQVRRYYQKYGVLTLLIGRFIPFGIRNCLFLTAGMGEMRFWKFLLSDGIACLISNTTLFSLAYYFGRNYVSFTQHLKWVNPSIFFAFLVALIGLFWYKRGKTVTSNVDE